jgi:molecular chaperone GrpE
MSEENDDIVLEEEREGTSPNISPDLVKKLRERLKKCEAEKQDYLAGWQRAKADFINARKDEEASRREFMKFSEKNLIFDLLDLADSFDAMQKHGELSAGAENIHRQLLNVLKSRGVEVIKALGEKFNPEEHESLGEIKVDKSEDENKIIEEIRKGYKMHNKIIRPSQVKIGKYE